MGPWRQMNEPTVRILDALVGLWTVVWLFLGGWSAVSVWSLADLGATMVVAGQALDTAGRGLQQVGAVPVVGTVPGELGDQVRATAERVASDGAEVTGQLRRLALLLGLSAFFIPVTPVLGLWVPLRLSRRREVQQLRIALRDHWDEPGLQRFLAHRAVERLPYATLTRCTADPYGDLAERRWHRLATLELGRLGLEPPAGPSGGRDDG